MDREHAMTTSPSEIAAPGMHMDATPGAVDSAAQPDLTPGNRWTLNHKAKGRLRQPVKQPSRATRTGTGRYPCVLYAEAGVQRNRCSDGIEGPR